MYGPGVPLPKVVYIVVRKHHNTRLFPLEDRMERDSDGTTGNVRPGMVVDRVVTKPGEFDFFLNSHAAIQGTNKPAHYQVLWDEVGVGADVVQLAAFWLCHTFCRCDR